MKFTVKVETPTGGRLGLITGISRLPQCQIETPTLMLYTKGGTVPHLTPEVLASVTDKPHVLRIPLGGILQYIEPLTDNPSKLALSKFIGLPEHVTCVTPEDPLETIPPGKHKNDTVAVWGRSGKFEFDNHGYAKAMDALRPDLYFCLADTNVTESSSKKRKEKSVDRTISFSKIDAKIDALTTIAGVSPADRQRCLDGIGNDFAGYALDGFLPDSDVLRIVSAPTVPNDKLRVVLGKYDPAETIELASAGIDAFDSAAIAETTDKAHAYTFEFDSSGGQRNAQYVDLTDETYRDDFGPLLDDCRCVTCTNHTRAYVHHLVTVKELLGSVLIAVHNLHHMLEFFQAIRAAIRDDTIDDLVGRIKKQFR